MTRDEQRTRKMISGLRALADQLEASLPRQARTMEITQAKRGRPAKAPKKGGRSKAVALSPQDNAIKTAPKRYLARPKAAKGGRGV